MTQYMHYRFAKLNNLWHQGGWQNNAAAALFDHVSKRGEHPLSVTKRAS